jgi:hypothetical protein
MLKRRKYNGMMEGIYTEETVIGLEISLAGSTQ